VTHGMVCTQRLRHAHAISHVLRVVQARLSTRKSNNILGDLQEYIRGVEAVAAARKDQLERIYEEQRDRERKERMAKDHCRSHENDFMNFGNLVNTPSKMRSLAEDVKAQKDKVKKFKEKAAIAGGRPLITNQQLGGMR
jgi:hypothetical protein